MKNYNYKKHLLTIQVLLSTYICGAQSITVKSIDELFKLSTNESIVYVIDPLSGGLFLHTEENGVLIDSGVVVKRKAGGTWRRQLNGQHSVSPYWWGAKGDGVNDDLVAINKATAFCLKNQTVLQFPSGIFRITDTWLIGGKTIQEKDLFHPDAMKAKSFQMRQHEISRMSFPLIVRGSTNTVIYGDFSSDELKAIVYYSIQSNGLSKRPFTQLFTHEFSNIGIYGNEYLKEGKMVYTQNPPQGNSQIGLAVFMNSHIRIQNCNFSYAKFGLLLNAVYFSSISDCYFSLCETGMYTTNYTGNTMSNLMGWYCKTMAELNAGSLVINGFNSEYCETTLRLKGRNVVINEMYCENDNKQRRNNHQIIIGRSNLDADYIPKPLTTGITINALVITTGSRENILLQDDVSDVILTSAVLDGPLETRSSTTNILTHPNIKYLKMNGPATIRTID